MCQRIEHLCKKNTLLLNPRLSDLSFTYVIDHCYKVSSPRAVGRNGVPLAQRLHVLLELFVLSRQCDLTIDVDPVEGRIAYLRHHLRNSSPRQLGAFHADQSLICTVNVKNHIVNRAPGLIHDDFVICKSIEHAFKQ